MLVWRALFLVSLGVLPLSAAPDALEIVRRAVETDHENDLKARNYVYTERTVTRELDRGGRVKGEESETHELVFVYGRPVERLVQKDGKPLSEQDAKDEDERIEKLTRKWGRESESDRQKRLAHDEEERRKAREFVREVPNAYSFKLAGEEEVNGRMTWIIDAEPRPDFKSRVPRADTLSKFRGRIWVDQREYQVVRIDCESIDTVSFGWVLARLQKGAHVRFEVSEVNGEVWLPKHFTVRFDARLGLLKSFRREIEQDSWGYRRFQTDSRLVEVKQAEPH
jgi:hypothetical protein